MTFKIKYVISLKMLLLYKVYYIIKNINYYVSVHTVIGHILADSVNSQ